LQHFFFIFVLYYKGMRKESKIESHQLVARIRSGDTQAFQSFIEQYKRLVIHIVFRMVSNTADREDLCQDVFLKAYQHLAGFRFESKVSTWIARIAYNVCINYLKKKRVPLYEDQAPDHDSLDNYSGGYISPDSFTEGRDIASRVREEIDKMEIRFRTILTLYHLEGMSYVEIGQIMNLPEGSVKSYLFRARKRLKERLMVKYQKEEIWNTNI